MDKATKAKMDTLKAEASSALQEVREANWKYNRLQNEIKSIEEGSLNIDFPPDELKIITLWAEKRSKSNFTNRAMMQRIVKYLKKLNGRICGHGFVCRGGPECGSDHK